jgi:imidazolonepropionase-like amidohydrolase
VRRSAVISLVVLAAATALPFGAPCAGETATPARIVIAASSVLDGRGHALKDVAIVVEGNRITSVGPSGGHVDLDLRGLTTLPGWIDAHTHITWSFGADGKNAGPDGTTPSDAYRAAANASATLLAGFTTVQSVGSATDVPLRDAIAAAL